MVKFNTPNGSRDIVFIFLDKIHTCQNSWTAELMKNMSDYVLSKILSSGYNVIQGVDEDILLQEAALTYRHAVVLSTGTEFINGNAFFNEVEKFIDSSYYFVMGHIPDREDGYYELHDQCYLINLTIYNQLGRPLVGKPSYYSAHTQLEPLRSEDNIHDDYTPTWVITGHTPKRYKHKWHGWNLLSVGFDSTHPILVFTEAFRKNKKYYYPNYEQAFLPASTYLYGKYSVAGQTLFYPYNTESVVALPDFKGPIKQLVIQASGLQFIKYLLEHKYNYDTTVRFVDYNLFALECMKNIVDSWNGRDYLGFVKEYAKGRATFLGKDGIEWLTLTGEEQTVDEETWIDIVSTVKFEYRHEDLVLNKGLSVSTWVNNEPNTIVHLSHIFNYDPVATFVPMSHRIYSERLLLEKLYKHVPDATIIMVDNVSNIPTRPTWHMNGDWDAI